MPLAPAAVVSQVRLARLPARGARCGASRVHGGQKREHRAPAAYRQDVQAPYTCSHCWGAPASVRRGPCAACCQSTIHRNQPPVRKQRGSPPCAPVVLDAGRAAAGQPAEKAAGPGLPLLRKARLHANACGKERRAALGFKLMNAASAYCVASPQSWPSCARLWRRNTGKRCA